MGHLSLEPNVTSAPQVPISECPRIKRVQFLIWQKFSKVTFTHKLCCTLTNERKNKLLCLFSNFSDEKFLCFASHLHHRLTYLPTSVTRKNRQMSINVAQNDFTRKMIDLQKLPKNVGDLGKLIVVTGLWKVAQSGHTATYVCCNSNQKMEMSLGIFFPEVRFIKNRRISKFPQN